MSGRKAIITILALTAIVSVARSAEAGLYVWDWTPASSNGTNVGYSDTGGRINSVHAEFDSTAKSLQWIVNFGDVPNYPTRETEGFTLALNNGPNPKGHSGELALLFFDASRSSPRLTAYGYNGQNSISTYFDGSERSGTQTPDRISTSMTNNAWIKNLIARDEADGSRTLGFEIDATNILGHTPMHPGPGGVADWFGLGFDNKLGVWMHPFASLSTSYNGAGFLTDWDGHKEGWLDGNDFVTTPEPGTLALLGIGLAAMIRRCRANA